MGSAIEQGNPAEANLLAFLARYTPEVQAIALRLRELVLETAPDAIEQIDLAANLLAYGFQRTYKGTLCVIMPYKAYVNLGFPNGVSLPDPVGLLVGTGKRARHVKIRTIDDAGAPELERLLVSALAQLRQKP